MTRAALFDAVKPYAPGARFTPAMVTMIDALADRFGLPRDATSAGWLPLAIDLIKQFEGCVLSAYADPATGGDPWTIGWGATGKGITSGVRWTQAQADLRLADDVMKFGNGVDNLLNGIPASAHEKAALVSLAYNIGLTNLGTSTLLKMHKAGDHAGAAKQFCRWNRAAGKVMAGLSRRRAAEALIYQGADA